MPPEGNSTVLEAPVLPASGMLTEGPLAGMLREGTTVILSVSPRFPDLSLAGLAYAALKELLPEVRHLFPDTRNADLPRVQSFGAHERGWLRAGALFETLLEDAVAGPIATVLCLDPWSASLCDCPPAALRDARWILISDLDARRHQEGTGYWDEIAKWLQDRSVQTVQARAFVGYLPEDFWTVGSPGKTGEVEESSAKGNGPRLLIEEAEDAPPSPGGILDAIRSTADRHDIVVLTPHLQRYLPEHKRELDRCAFALDTRDLDVSAYVRLLRSADEYLPLGSLPYGNGPLVNLRPGTRILECAPQESNGTQFRQPASVHPTGTDAPTSRDGPERAPASETEVNPFRFVSSLVGKHEIATDDITPPHVMPKTIRFSILTCCYKYLQRFRIFLNSIVRQDLPLEQIEVRVALPGNPDGVAEYLDLMRLAHPRLNLHVAEVAESDRKNRGKMINAAFEGAEGATVMVADCDIILPPYFVRTVLDAHREDSVLGCWRTPLSEEVTAHIVTGNLDPIDLFDALKDKWDPREAKHLREGVLGYCQVLRRDHFTKVPYPAEFDQINQSDIVFVERLAEQLKVSTQFMDNLFVLHLAHPRDWSGTKVYL